ncbi:hypothetical protein A3G63_03295 [Candidatus Kaiserbacteria bacterium RIFCSPLOWO2_12_FULL_52_8]|uniref:EfeO-type cupredoxin-like domain-containing protein n=1 Tax=Candidatus Kaiserbacteria bacterium RIFCSPHIGHO2_01_FULL_53_31 TaxID=1798481 RepID=A0A1F6CIS1_9BACT|nr:MAG: hypothetical protein A2678_02520 [Candidatus Kaiserbacteria bacterium RIFCSPHIGHO2_01_FULL_53_31]OGG93518.1 MAG: hypothetical protein A3G63_03295 [Candidatus Kaiserbacteria bacterium RIFCSPLOWO2_12_FULL_52_8]
MKATYIAITIAAVFIGGALLFGAGGSGESVDPPGNNVSIVDGKQIIDMRAKGGYSPRSVTARAGIPTILRFHTSGTFDCSSSLRIPSLGVSRYLPSTGTTDITIDDPQVGPLQGMCSMGMYRFRINFQQ